MGCPSCGGSDRILVAPGYWECRSLVEEHRAGLVPDGMGGTRPVTDVIRRPCELRYHQAAGGGPTLLCEWDQGTFAIGLCADCGKPVCGDHSRLYQDRRLCIQDVNAREEAAALAAVEARLTPEKFLVLAEAAGNPGLQSWTMREIGKELAVRKEGLFRTVKYERWVTTDESEIRGWAIPEGYQPDDLMISDKGVIYSFRGLYSDPYMRFSDGTLLTKGIVVPADGSNGWSRVPSDESKDRFLRELCRNLGIPV
jgi:hypothetical protein